MHNSIRGFLILIFVLCSLPVVFSQNNGLLIERSLHIKIPFTITQFSTKNGLPQSRVIDIVSKDNGNLIIATANGIVEYNGTEFSSFIKDNSYKSFFFHKLIWHDSSENLFGITDKGILQVYPVVKLLDSGVDAHFIGDTLFSIHENGEIFSALVTQLKFKKRYATEIVQATCISRSDNGFYIGSKSGLFKFDSYSLKTQRLHTSDFFAFKTNPFDSTLYGWGLKSIYKIEDSKVNLKLDLMKENKEAIIGDLDFINSEDLYVSTTKGLYEVTATYTDSYTKLSALPTSYLQALLYNSKENCLFVGTGEKGLLKLQFKNCYSFTAEQGFSEASSLSSIIRSPAGKLMVADNEGTFYQFKIDTVIKLITLNVFCSSLSEIDGLIFAGTWNKGVYILKETTIIDSIKSPLQIPDPRVHAAFKDSKGIIWIGTSKGLAKGTTIKDIRPFLQNKIPNSVICFYELKNKRLCIGGSDGVTILDSENNLIKQLGKKDGLLGKEVRAFYEDEEGKLWIGTYDGGLYCYHRNVLTNINQLKNAKLDMDAFCLAKDGLGYIYITSNHGLWRLTEKKLNDFYYGKIDYLIPFYYNEETGIVNTEFNGGFQNNFLRTRMNHLYFPSIEGVVIVDPEQTSFRKLIPKIDKLFVNDTLHDFKQNKLNNKTFSVAFNFSSLSFINKYNVYFQYKLESGKKTDWSPLQKNASVNFKMLPAGHYTFSVRALDAFNDELPNVASYSFEIEPVFYDTLWFKMLSFIFVIGLASIIIKMRITRFRKAAEEKERVRRQLAEFELKAIHAQMNPHFIFNSLNSIKYYLSINDQKNADNYIDHFSSLLRSFLENGSKDFIALKDEILILTSYLELEKQRMNPPFSFSIQLDPEIQNQVIPTHLIQPFVENAIKHGINHSEKQCTLVLRFSKHEHFLVCVIDDNGIGREQAGIINKNRVAHTSRGIEMVKEKIRIVKEIYKFELLLNIEDKYDEQNKPAGTRVEIKIPLSENENNHR